MFDNENVPDSPKPLGGVEGTRQELRPRASTLSGLATCLFETVPAIVNP